MPRYLVLFMLLQILRYLTQLRLYSLMYLRRSQCLPLSSPLDSLTYQTKTRPSLPEKYLLLSSISEISALRCLSRILPGRLDSASSSYKNKYLTFIIICPL